MAIADDASNGLMRIGVFVDPERVRRWHGWLLTALIERGHQVDVCVGGVSCPMPAKLRLLLRMERLIYRPAGANASDQMPVAALGENRIREAPSRTGYDLVIDLAGDTRLQERFRCRRFRPLYDGLPGEADLIGQLLEGRGPRLALDDSALPEPRRFGLCAIEHPDVILKALNNVYSRVVCALLKAVDEIAEDLVSRPPDAVSGARTEYKRGKRRPAKPAPFFMQALSGKLRGRLRRLAGNAPRWGVGWRFTGGRPLRDGGELRFKDFNRLPDDGKRFYADPFVVWRDGLYHLFVEDYPYEIGKAHITHFTISEAGELSEPQLVLSRPYHLSYPNLFEHDGALFMIPESSSNRTVELYRAVEFPDKWVREQVLIEGVRLDDVTLHHDGERWWMFATMSDWQSSTWDALALYSAPQLTGPWTPHQANPVLLDARAARPAGKLFRRDGALYRPAQDCSTGYGAGLSLCRIERLDDEGFEQTVEQHYDLSASRRFSGLHTLNETHGLEVIDFFGRF